ncbi:MAG: hypothetical protein JXR03_13135 [Cyclobacteriaceae bacterium]
MSIVPKYRSLTSDELTELQKEFIDYLVVNGITADQWVRIKEEDEDTAEDMITLFSDVVMEGVLRQVKYLEYRSKSDIKTFQCLENQIVLVGMNGAEAQVDFLNENFFEEAIANPPKGIKIYTTSKAYNKERQKEIFDMISSGCSISDGTSFKAISMSLQ